MTTDQNRNWMVPIHTHIRQYELDKLLEECKTLNIPLNTHIANIISTYIKVGQALIDNEQISSQINQAIHRIIKETTDAEQQ